jgi:hypothetical protein
MHGAGSRAQRRLGFNDSGLTVHAGAIMMMVQALLMQSNKQQRAPPQQAQQGQSVTRARQQLELMLQLGLFCHCHILNDVVTQQISNAFADVKGFSHNHQMTSTCRLLTMKKHCSSVALSLRTAGKLSLLAALISQHKHLSDCSFSRRRCVAVPLAATARTLQQRHWQAAQQTVFSSIKHAFYVQNVKL